MQNVPSCQQHVRLNMEDYLYCGELNATKLAEECALEFDMFEQVGSDCNVPEELYEYAAKIADEIENDSSV